MCSADNGRTATPSQNQHLYKALAQDGLSLIRDLNESDTLQ